MRVSATFLTEPRAEVLRAVCDTVVPAIDHAPDPHGHWARSASSYGVPQALAETLQTLPPDQQQGMALLLDLARSASRSTVLSALCLAAPLTCVRPRSSGCRHLRCVELTF